MFGHSIHMHELAMSSISGLIARNVAPADTLLGIDKNSRELLRLIGISEITKN